MKMKNCRWQMFSWLMIGVLLLTTILPGTIFATATPTANINGSYVRASTNPDKKINARLKEQFKGKKMVTFLVKLGQQVDAKKVAEKTVKKAEQQKQTMAKTELMKRSAVVSSLRATTDETQQNLKKYLSLQQRIGKVKQVESFYIVNALAVTATEDVMKKLATFPEVAKILPNETRQLIAPHSKKTAIVASIETKIAMVEKAITKKAQTSFVEPTSSVEWNVERVHAPEVWDQGIDGTGIVVANIDTGVRWDHPALKEKYRGYNPADPKHPDHEYNWFDAVHGQSAPYDEIGHGTHTMGTMVGSEPDGTNQIGVAPGAKWITVKAFTCWGGTDVDLLKAGEWILAPKDADGNPHPEQAPDIVNNSWGGGPDLDEWYRLVVQNWRAADIFPEFSAGNEGPGNGSIANPANYPESISTGAIDIDDQLAFFSSRGPSPYEESKPEISAPGVDIRSSVPNGGYEDDWSGTSMAGPHVAAVAALLKQAAASLTVDELEQILITAAFPLTDSTYPISPNNGYGYGVVDAKNAMAAVQKGLGKVSGQVSARVKAAQAPSSPSPLRATVSILESRRATPTNPEDGSYSMIHPAGTFTLRAEAYGYRSQDQTVEILRDGNVEANFIMEEIPKGTIHGTVVDRVTQQPIANATLSLLEDAAIVPVKTDAEGGYTIEAYEGSYTLHVAGANYYAQDENITVTGDSDAEVNIALKPFVGYPGEISYDDGTAEDALAFLEAGQGWAVRMSLPAGKKAAMVTGGLFLFHDASFPEPGGTHFQVAVYDASGPDGSPGKKLVGPVNATALRNGEWTEVDLSEFGLVVDGDFYLLFLQSVPYPDTPALALDENSEANDRNWVFYRGMWDPIPAEFMVKGMIRARVSYESTGDDEPESEPVSKK
jgi:subtilisin family serine protease